MRKHLVTSALAILTLGSVAMPASADGHGENGGHVRRVRLQDNCDPVTFDAALKQPGACVPHGNRHTVTFDEFLAKLNPTDFGHPQWNMKPDKIELESGDAIKAVVRGGEFHTFTEVMAFGPGCVAFINGALGLTGPAPTPAQCADFMDMTGVAPGGSLTVANLSPGTHMFMCEIHPWMRAVVTVGGDENKGDD